MSHLIATQHLHQEEFASDGKHLVAWRAALTPAIKTLQQMAGTTEDEFLQIGSEIQGFYQRSSDITRMSNELVGVVSGNGICSLTGRLQQIMTDMNTYLAEARARSSASCSSLERVACLLGELSEPMEGFRKLNKTLRMLSISTKIESARLGLIGSDFVNLAMDVEKLSHQVSDKSAAILAHRQLLEVMIRSNIVRVHSSEAAQDAEVASSINRTAASLRELVSVNERCSLFGTKVSSISSEVTKNISEVVSSMQMHDMTRQQAEHIALALERLEGNLAGFVASANESERCRAMIVESGDVSELQEAQLRFAAAELYAAVRLIIANLRDVACKQSVMALETRSVAGVADSSGSSFVDVMSQGMTSITAALTSCASADRDMLETMNRVAQTVGQIASFVTDIETVGSEIKLIALNAQIKAALTGSEGAALGVLAEAIKRLSDEAVYMTDSVAKTLTNIDAVTEHLTLNAGSEVERLGSRTTSMKEEVAEVLLSLSDMNRDLLSILSGLSIKVASLTDDIEKVVSGIDVHERIKVMSDSVLATLEQIVHQARQFVPASSEFKQNLHHMEEQYTMESERHIHEALTRQRSGQGGAVVLSVAMSGSEESEFGDNVDLF